VKTISYAAQSASSPLAPFDFERRNLRPNDVAMEMLYSGVCHGDPHQARNDWGWNQYPMVPRHEIVGKVIAVGSEVKRYKVGDHVAVGCMVDFCGAAPVPQGLRAALPQRQCPDL
jgi:alcohol dehydrogenase (NADP+)